MFYPHFQTPHLSLNRSESGTNIYLADGRHLLRQDLPPDAEVLECYEAAIHEIEFLVFRDLVDLLPLLKPYGDNEWFALQKKDFYPIRYVALLRGKIPFIRLTDLKKVTKRMWPHMQENLKKEPERFPGKGKFAKVVSCDWACLVSPESIHADIYAHGRFATTSSFDQSYVFNEAQRQDIIIDTLLRHPLEGDLKWKVTREREDAKKSNGLPVPPEMPTKEAADEMYGRLDTSLVKEQRRVKDELTYNRVKARIIQASTIPCYKVDTTAVDRHQYMNYIVWSISEGRRITEVCKGVEGMPSLLEVHKWRQMYPDFELDLKAAEEIQAQIFAERALDIAERVEDKDDVPVAKFKHRAYMERAALQAEKFRPKQVIQTENLENKNVADLKRQLKTLLQGNMEHLTDVLDVELLGQTEGQPPEEE